MKRLQILMDEELDEALAQRARDERTSKGALIRRYVREHVDAPKPIEQDPIWDLVGMVRGEPGEAQKVDEVVYGKARRS